MDLLERHIRLNQLGELDSRLNAPAHRELQNTIVRILDIDAKF